MSTAAAVRPSVLPAATRDGPVVLAVRDRDAMVAWYRNALGFVEQARGPARSVLGAPGGVPLVVLEAAPGRPEHDPATAGLFHAAYLMPDRTELARWVAHVARHRIPIEGASDHLVSEAFYLADPEGNGIEVYRDRPRQEWRRRGDEIVMDTLPADIRGLLVLGESLPEPFRAAPAGTTMGHVHLKVADLDATRRFYVDTLGFDLVTTYPGALFVAAGGYHHHYGLNVWRSRGRPHATRDELGLVATTLVVPGADAVGAAADRLAAAGYAVEVGPSGPVAVDPAGLRLGLAAEPPTAESLAAG